MTIAAILLLAAQAVPVSAGVQWEPVGVDSGGRYEIDPASLVRDGDRVRFLMRAFPARPETDGTSFAITRYMIDCRQRAWAIEAGDLYRADGSVAVSLPPDANAMFRPIEERTGAMHLLRRVCPAAS